VVAERLTPHYSVGPAHMWCRWGTFLRGSRSCCLHRFKVLAAGIRGREGSAGFCVLQLFSSILLQISFVTRLSSRAPATRTEGLGQCKLRGSRRISEYELEDKPLNLEVRVTRGNLATSREGLPADRLNRLSKSQLLKGNIHSLMWNLSVGCHPRRLRRVNSRSNCSFDGSCDAQLLLVSF
jgi:hypothetical protein